MAVLEHWSYLNTHPYTSHRLSWPGVLCWGPMWWCLEAVQVLLTAGGSWEIALCSVSILHVALLSFKSIWREKRQLPRPTASISDRPRAFPWTDIRNQLISHCGQQISTLLHSSELLYDAVENADKLTSLWQWSHKNHLEEQQKNSRPVRKERQLENDITLLQKEMDNFLRMYWGQKERACWSVSICHLQTQFNKICYLNEVEHFQIEGL